MRNFWLEYHEVLKFEIGAKVKFTPVPGRSFAFMKNLDEKNGIVTGYRVGDIAGVPISRPMVVVEFVGSQLDKRFLASICLFASDLEKI